MNTAQQAGITIQPRTLHWRDEIPESRRRAMRAWLWAVAAMTFGVLVVGGITRLTLSGLSIVDWRPLTGVIPPLTDGQWQQAFDAYRQSPDYAWRSGMDLDAFRFIYFWEYLHRLLARTIGVVFLVPFVVFAVRGWFTGPMLRRALLLFALGAAQGVMGWLMVASGLVDRPSVSHFRLAAHLSLAFGIFGWCVWLVRELSPPRGSLPAGERTLLTRGVALVGALFALQVVWGAFVAGLRGGKYYPTFPTMGGRLVPGELTGGDGVLSNIVAHPVAVQWVHRVLGTLLALAVIALFALVRRRVRDEATVRYATSFLFLIGIQYALGVATLLALVPVSLGVIHQGAALIIFGVWLSWMHHVSNPPAHVPAGAVTWKQ